MKALVFAAGLGTRLKPLTDSMPKAMVEVGGKPLLHHILSKLQASGINDIVVNVHHFSEQIIEFLNGNEQFRKVKVSDESAALLDTGGGLRKAIPLFSDDDAPILIHNVDILSNVDLRLFYEENFSNDVTLLVSRRKTSRYLLVRDNRLVGWTNIDTQEVKTPYKDLDIGECEYLAFSGIHIFSPKLLPLLSEFPSAFPIMDFYISQCHRLRIHCCEMENLSLVDVGKISTLKIAEDFLAGL